MPTRADDQIELTERLSRLLKSPERLKALVLMLERKINPKELARELGISLSAATHHVNELRKMGFIELVGEEPRRVATAHFYRAVLRPIWSSEDWEKLSVEERQEYATWVLQLTICDVAQALFAGTFQRRADTHTSSTPLYVDEQGRRELDAIQDDALEASLVVEQESAKRLAESGEEGQHVSTAIFCIDLPGPSRPQQLGRLER